MFQADASIHAKLTAFGQCTDTTAFIEVIIGQYLTHANTALVDPEKLEVVSYYGHNIKTTPDYTKADGSFCLALCKLLYQGILQTFCLQRLTWMRISLILIKQTHLPPFSLYTHLPQTTITVTNSANKRVQHQRGI